MKMLLAISLSLVAIATQAEDKAGRVNNEDEIDIRAKDTLERDYDKLLKEGFNQLRPGTPEFEKSIRGVITRYNNGFINQDLEAVLSCLDQSFFKITMQEGTHPAHWRPDLLHSGDDLKEWIESYLNIRPYENQITYHQITYQGATLSGNLGIAHTVEIGRRGPMTWNRAKNIWILGKVDGELKIRGIFVGQANPLTDTSHNTQPPASGHTPLR